MHKISFVLIFCLSLMFCEESVGGFWTKKSRTDQTDASDDAALLFTEEEVSKLEVAAATRASGKSVFSGAGRQLDNALKKIITKCRPHLTRYSQKLDKDALGKYFADNLKKMNRVLEIIKDDAGTYQENNAKLFLTAKTSSTQCIEAVSRSKGVEPKSIPGFSSDECSCDNSEKLHNEGDGSRPSFEGDESNRERNTYRKRRRSLRLDGDEPNRGRNTYRKRHRSLRLDGDEPNRGRNTYRKRHRSQRLGGDESNRRSAHRKRRRSQRSSYEERRNRGRGYA